MVNNYAELTQRLQDTGLRLTPQRLLILDTLQQTDDHISAEEILTQVRATYPFVNISTVYRTLDTLRELALVTVAHLGNGGVRYHWVDKSRHHHLVCQRCGAVYDLDEDLTNDLAISIEHRYAFRPSFSHLSIFGTCSRCLS